jgi:hypothetical protein
MYNTYKFGLDSCFSYSDNISYDVKHNSNGELFELTVDEDKFQTLIEDVQQFLKNSIDNFETEITPQAVLCSTRGETLVFDYAEDADGSSIDFVQLMVYPNSVFLQVNYSNFADIMEIDLNRIFKTIKPE